MKIEHWSIKRLRPYANNPRVNDHAVDQMADAIETFGFRVPIIVKSCGEIVDGHLRLKAANKLKLEIVPVILADDLTDDQIKALRLSINKLSELADWDDDKLFAELSEIADLNFDLSHIGFDESELELLFSSHDDESGGNTDEDSEPNISDVEQITKLGDVWTLGLHRLICGDSTDNKVVSRLFDGTTADICFTSPPYNIGNDGVGSKRYIGSTKKDNLSQNDYTEFLNNFIRIALNYCQYVFCNVQSISGNKLALIDLLHGLKDIYADTIIWDKLHTQPAMGKNVLNSDFEYVHIFSKKANRVIGTKYFRGTLSNIVKIQSIDKKEFSSLHKATFPVEFAKFFISNFSRRDGSVYEPFTGTGSTMIACETLGRSCYGVELNPLYVDVSVKRWEDYSGKKAVINGD